MRKLTTFLLITLMALTSLGKERPKVALVLSGGGAKGSAHVGVLRVLEEAGIPIDMIVGTSMGSLVGGLYAYGYNANQLDSILSNQDWMNLLTDKKRRVELSISDRLVADKYALNLSFHKSPTEAIEGGILKGNNVSRLLCELTAENLSPMDYSKLPIPFACVATDITTDSEIDMTSGILAESMRCSMSIPGVFAPVPKEEMLLVDGGLLNNYPVDVARQLGADIVIGVDVTTPLRSAQKIKTIPEILGQVLDIACINKFEENVEKTDVYIKVNVQGYSSSSFHKESIDSLIVRGELAARGALPQLISLREQFGLADAPIVPKPARALPAKEELPAVSTIYAPEEKKNWVGLGVRFDDEEYAAILLGGRYCFKHKIVPNLYAEVRLGQRLWATFGSKFQIGRNWWVDGGYKLSYSKIKLYEQGHQRNNVEYVQDNFWLQFSKNWHNITFNLGGEFNHISYNPLIVEDEIDPSLDLNGTDYKSGIRKWWKEQSMKYYVKMQFDNMDARVFPTRGVSWSLNYEYLTDNGATYLSKMGMHQASAYFKAAIPVAKNSTLLPWFSARYIPNENEYYFNKNYIGGIDVDGRYLPQHISFAGVKYAQEVNNLFGAVGAMFRQSFPKNHFAFAMFNYGFGHGSGRSNSDIFIKDEEQHITSENYYGGAVGYGYKTPLGPLEACIGYCNQSRFGFTIQLGYKF